MNTIRLFAAVSLAMSVVATPQVALADPVPGVNVPFPRCGAAPDDDGRYCVVSVTRNGIVVVPPAPGTPYSDVEARLLGPGSILVEAVEFLGPLGNRDTTSLTTADVWEVTLNSGDTLIRAADAVARDVAFTRGGSAASGYTQTLRFRTTPVAWASGSCAPPPGACPDAIVATERYPGWGAVSLSDMRGWNTVSGQPLDDWAGWSHASNAQVRDLPQRRDDGTNTIVLGTTNPHFAAPGVVATGFIETVLPYRMLTNVLAHPSPRTIVGGSLVVTRSDTGGVRPATFAVTHLADAIRIVVDPLTYSSPTISIRIKPTRPGAPRLTRVRRAAATRAIVTFRRPLANGGRTITGYVARCTSPGRPTRLARGVSPLVVSGLRAGATYRCSARAVNALGAGPFSKAVVATP